MSSTLKVLNIDALVVPTRALSIDGIEHPVLELSVESFLETSAALKRLESGNGPAEIADQVVATIDMICRSVPTVPRARMEQIPLSKLQDIMSFVRGDELVPEVVDTPAEEAASKEAPAKKRPARK